MLSHRTVGPLDALARGLLALLVLGLAFYGVRVFGADWALTFITFAFVLAGYLGATAVAGVDPLYNARRRKLADGTMEPRVRRSWRARHLR